jgi:hypothetical protein
LSAPLDLPDRLSLGNAYPNPTNGRVALALALPGSARVEFAVYDIQGRVVWSQGERVLSAGRTALSWAGHDQHGSHVTPGVYLARVLVDGQAFTRRFALIR